MMIILVETVLLMMTNYVDVLFAMILTVKMEMIFILKMSR